MDWVMVKNSGDPKSSKLDRTNVTRQQTLWSTVLKQENLFVHGPVSLFDSDDPKSGDPVLALAMEKEVHGSNLGQDQKFYLWFGYNLKPTNMQISSNISVCCSFFVFFEQLVKQQVGHQFGGSFLVKKCSHHFWKSLQNRILFHSVCRADEFLFAGHCIFVITPAIAVSMAETSCKKIRGSTTAPKGKHCFQELFKVGCYF